MVLSIISIFLTFFLVRMRDTSIKFFINPAKFWLVIVSQNTLCAIGELRWRRCILIHSGFKDCHWQAHVGGRLRMATSLSFAFFSSETSGRKGRPGEFGQNKCLTPFRYEHCLSQCKNCSLVTSQNGLCRCLVGRISNFLHG